MLQTLLPCGAVRTAVGGAREPSELDESLPPLTASTLLGIICLPRRFTGRERASDGKGPTEGLFNRVNMSSSIHHYALSVTQQFLLVKFF